MNLKSIGGYVAATVLGGAVALGGSHLLPPANSIKTPVTYDTNTLRNEINLAQKYIEKDTFQLSSEQKEDIKNQLDDLNKNYILYNDFSVGDKYTKQLNDEFARADSLAQNAVSDDEVRDIYENTVRVADKKILEAADAFEQADKMMKEAKTPQEIAAAQKALKNAENTAVNALNLPYYW